MKERVVDEQKAEHNKLKVSAYKVSVSRDLSHTNTLYKVGD